MREIRQSEFTADVNERKLSRKELAAKYELPESEIKLLLKRFGLSISRKRFDSYVVVEDVVPTIPVDADVTAEIKPVEEFQTEEII